MVAISDPDGADFVGGMTVRRLAEPRHRAAVDAQTGLPVVRGRPEAPEPGGTGGLWWLGVESVAMCIARVSHVAWVTLAERGQPPCTPPHCPKEGRGPGEDRRCKSCFAFPGKENTPRKQPLLLLGVVLVGRAWRKTPY